MGKNRCRLLARGYRNFWKWDVKIRPRWLDHLNTNKILEQDLPLIVGQQQQIEKLAQNLKQTYFPLKTSDLLFIEHRKWLYKYGSILPYYQGYTTSKKKEKVPLNLQQLVDSERLNRHTQICSSCSRAYQTTIRLKQILIGIAIALAAVAIITDVSQIKMVAVMSSILSVIMAVVATQVKTRFERSYTRY